MRYGYYIMSLVDTIAHFVKIVSVNTDCVKPC